MKELSIQEKAKAYDKAIEIAKSEYQIHKSFNGFREMLIRIFPELKESEDEESKKWILEYLYDGLRKADEQFKDQFKCAIAWLEKQGEQKPITIDIDKMVSKYSHTKDGDFGLPVNCQIRAYRQGINDALNLSLGIKKQAEQEEPQVYETEDDEVITYSESEGYKVVEPKFKVGDWLVNNERRIIIKVLKATPLGYKAVDVLGYHHTITDTAIENNYHLWTIKDAKKGDVLVAENIIFIYKKALASHIVSYCKLINDVFEPTVDARTCCEGNPYVYPATIEQRELLFAKMEEAGYTFDFRNMATFEKGKPYS